MSPIVISIPHGGTAIPPEVADRVCLTAQDLFDDIDAFTREIYDVGGDVSAVIAADVARTFVDLNRSPDDLPPVNPDGVVKTMTCQMRPIYHEGNGLDRALTETLIGRYHTPYHRRLERATRRPDVRLGLDCHSMSQFPPPIAPDAAVERPLFCLSNADGATCPPRIMEALARALATAFECNPNAIRFNDPFRGGYITRRLGNQPVPWIQVEMNRVLYLNAPWLNPTTRTVAGERLDELRTRFRQALLQLSL